MKESVRTTITFQESQMGMIQDHVGSSQRHKGVSIVSYYSVLLHGVRSKFLGGEGVVDGEGGSIERCLK